jgi:6-pyruvoyltetrahydropterin/6-carboxytetrahydropterin synthase
MITIKQRIEWDSAHRVTRHESKCRTLHGHRYLALVEVGADMLDSASRVVDFGVVKAKLKEWVDEFWDHTTLLTDQDAGLRAFFGTDTINAKGAFLFANAEPTAETIASYLFDKAVELLEDDHRLVVMSVEVFETPNCSAKRVR